MPAVVVSTWYFQQALFAEGQWRLSGRKFIQVVQASMFNTEWL
jgi:hypothetical protein